MPANILREPQISRERCNTVMECLVKEDLSKDGLSYKVDVSEPRLGVDEVKIRVLATAVCGTDKSIYHSAQNEGIRREMQRYLGNGQFQPIVVGHEFCGIVESVAEAGQEGWNKVSPELRIEPGDYVTAEMHLSCGLCYLCRTGK